MNLKVSTQCAKFCLLQFWLPMDTPRASFHHISCSSLFGTCSYSFNPAANNSLKPIWVRSRALLWKACLPSHFHSSRLLPSPPHPSASLPSPLIPSPQCPSSPLLHAPPLLFPHISSPHLSFLPHPDLLPAPFHSSAHPCPPNLPPKSYLLYSLEVGLVTIEELRMPQRVE